MLKNQAMSIHVESLSCSSPAYHDEQCSPTSPMLANTDCQPQSHHRRLGSLTNGVKLNQDQRSGRYNDVEISQVCDRNGEDPPSIRILKRPFRKHVVSPEKKSKDVSTKEQKQIIYRDLEAVDDHIRICRPVSKQSSERQAQRRDSDDFGDVISTSVYTLDHALVDSGLSHDQANYTFRSPSRARRRLKLSPIIPINHVRNRVTPNQIQSPCKIASCDTSRISLNGHNLVGQAGQSFVSPKSCPQTLQEQVTIPTVKGTQDAGPSSMSGSARARQSFKLPMNNGRKKTLDEEPSALVTVFSDVSDGSRGWETAGGRQLQISRDPALAAQWCVPSQAQAATRTDVCTVEPMPYARQQEATASLQDGVRNETLARRREVFRLQAHLASLRDEVKTIESALTIEARNEELNLLYLKQKWIDVAQQACEEVFGAVSVKLQRFGGFKEWCKVQNVSCETSQCPNVGACVSQRSMEDEYAPTMEEKIAMGDMEEDFTMQTMLEQFRIPMNLIQYDQSLCRWY